MRTNTLADLLQLAPLLGERSYLLAIPVEEKYSTIVLTKGETLNCWSLDMLNSVLDKHYYLCTYDEATKKVREAPQLFVPFDKKRAPLTDNLMVYINGQILWDNVRLAQQSKEL